MHQQIATNNRIYEPVDYDDDLHRYSNGGLRYTSATQLIDKFKHKFDVEERSVYMADRYGNTPQYWKDKWKRINSDSLGRGNEIHDREERVMYQQKFIEMNPDNLPVLNPSDYTKVYYNLPDGVYPEMLLWRHDKQLAGRADKTILTTWGYLNPIRTAHIQDYKTNKKIRRYSWQNPDGTYDMMLGPLSHLMDCEWNHYSLQLSIYQYMLEYFGFLPGNRTIIHFPHEIEGLGIPSPVPYSLPYLRDEVISMLSWTN